MHYETLKHLPDDKFRRLTGIKHRTFKHMIEILRLEQSQKMSRGGRPHKLCLEDRLLMTLDYQGLQKQHQNTVLPTKASKLTPLIKQDKQSNREASSERVANEHAIAFLKRFKIISERYRNRGKRFGLRFNLITAICNFEIT